MPFWSIVLEMTCASFGGSSGPYRWKIRKSPQNHQRFRFLPNLFSNSPIVPCHTLAPMTLHLNGCPQNIVSSHELRGKGIDTFSRSERRIILIAKSFCNLIATTCNQLPLFLRNLDTECETDFAFSRIFADDG